MTKTMINIVNVTTGEEIEREMNAEEIAQRELDVNEANAIAQMETQKLADKAALLAKLGITDDEAKLLLS